MAEERTCQNCKSEFTIEPDDFLFYEKMKVPPPTFCPQCRFQRRWAWRNERTFHRNTCAKCKKSIISVFSPESGLAVYCSPCWWSDSWDGMEHGMDYDPKKPFLLQVRELLSRVPVMNVFGLYTTLQNSEYTSAVSYLKNCYMITHSDSDENCAYGSMIDNTKDSVDNLMLNGCELSYESVNCQKCYRTFFSLDSEGCQDVWFSRDCVGCSNCFGCVGLRKKNYYIYNKPVSKDEYEVFIREQKLDSFSGISRARQEGVLVWNFVPQKYMHERHNNNVSGDYMYNSKDTLDSFVVYDGENSRFCSFITPGGMKDCYDVSHYGTSSEMVYETLQTGNQVSRVICSWWVVNSCRDVEYSMFAVGGCENVFGCVGIKKKQYCILNKQYDKESFEKLRKEIIDQMNEGPYADKQGNIYRYGEFFPAELSPFGYNETTAQDFFPLREDEAKSKGYGWRTFANRDYKPTVQANELPDSIDEVMDSILQEIVACGHGGLCDEQCTGAYKIVRQELDFYRRMKLPLPRLCPNCRHYGRLKWRNSIILIKCRCACAGKMSQNGVYQNIIAHSHGDSPCPNEFETSYSLDSPEIVYCEQCYNAEVV